MDIEYISSSFEILLFSLKGRKIKGEMKLFFLSI